MKNKIFWVSAVIFFIFCFVIFYKSLNNSNLYIPKSNDKKDIPFFVAKDFYSGINTDSKKIFEDESFYLVNIWASWCLPCRKEHPILMNLSKNKSIRIIGLNYKDKLSNGKKFIKDLGDPYYQILIDENGILAVEFGAYGIPETYIINKNKKIIKKFIGPLNKESLKQIELLLR